MAQKIVLIDDLDGSEATQTIEFSMNGDSYRIDLNEKNASAMEKALSKYIEAAAHVPAVGNVAARRRSTRAGSKIDLEAIRSWAHQNGYQVAERGRIAKAVVEAYEAAI